MRRKANPSQGEVGTPTSTLGRVEPDDLHGSQWKPNGPPFPPPTVLTHKLAREGDRAVHELG